MSSQDELSYLQRYLVEEEVEHYQQRAFSRRELLRRVLLITGSVPLAAGALAATGCTPAQPTSPTVAPATTGPANPPAGTAASPTAPAASPTRAAAVTSPVASPTRAVAPSPSPAVRPDAGPSPSPSPVARNPVTVDPNDPGIIALDVQFPGQAGPIRGYLATPRGLANPPAIIVIHENRGLAEQIKDVARRYAKSGFAALAVDLVSRRGGTESFSDPAQISGQIGQIPGDELVADLISGIEFLQRQPQVGPKKVGAIGYCFGGGMVWLLATRSDQIGAAMPFYGSPPQPIDEVQHITAPVYAIYGENDPRINQNIPRIEEAMRRYNKEFQYKVYPGAGHAFNNNTGANYNEAAARDSYQISLNFFRRHLT